MNLPDIIAHLRAACPTLGNRVAGAAEYERANDEGFLDLPAAYVVPEDMAAGPNENIAGLFQRITERVAVIVVFDNSTDLPNDRRGQGATELYYPMKLELFAALGNWRPPSIAGDVDPRASRGMYLVSGEYLASDRARLAYQWLFALDVQFTDADGWQAATDPLEQVDVQTPAPVIEALIDVPQD